MATTIRFQAHNEYVRDRYYSRKDVHKLSEEEKKEVLSYKNTSKSFDYCDWFGSCTTVRATITAIEEDKYGYLIFTVTVNKTIPDRFVPLPSEILEHRGLLFPISYSQI